MSYAEITFKDKNPIKRWLQQRRLVAAIEGSASPQSPAVVCDFGAGNGELCKYISKKYPNARIICYEPVDNLMAQAKDNLSSVPNVDFCTDINALAAGSIDVLFALEVFEHLPPRETDVALHQIDRCLNAHGIAVFGVPVEIGLPALYKGCFRMIRRFGEYDATFKNVALSLLRFPPKNRPMAEIAPGFHFYFHHTGFDYRRLKDRLDQGFDLQAVFACPFLILGRWLNPEIYFVTRKQSR